MLVADARSEPPVAALDPRTLHDWFVIVRVAPERVGARRQGALRVPLTSGVVHRARQFASRTRSCLESLQIDGHAARQLEPRLTKLGLEAEAPSRPLRRSPDRDEHDEEDDGDLAPQDLGGGQERFP